MKKILYGVISVMLLFLGSACEKDDTNEFKSTASIMVVNATVGSVAVKVNPGATTGFSYAKSDPLNYGVSLAFGAYTGNNTISVVSSADTTKTLFTRTVDLQPISTLYLAGQASSVDTIFRTETNFPFIQGAVVNPDNSAYIRFVHLSPNSPPLDVNFGSTTPSEVTGLAYKGISPFKKYAVPLTGSNLIFTVKESGGTGNIATVNLTLNNIRYKTISIIVRGLKSGTGADVIGTTTVTYN